MLISFPSWSDLPLLSKVCFGGAGAGLLVYIALVIRAAVKKHEKEHNGGKIVLHIAGSRRMADDPPPPSPRSWRRFFSGRNEQKGVRKDTMPSFNARLEQPRPMSDLRDRSSDNEALFVQSMADTARRRIAFNVVERNCREAFAGGKAGMALFLQVRGLVERAQVQEAINEFDRRFEPMLDQRVLAGYRD
jgi:hypothetical protein